MPREKRERKEKGRLGREEGGRTVAGRAGQLCPARRVLESPKTLPVTSSSSSRTPPPRTSPYTDSFLALLHISEADQGK